MKKLSLMVLLLAALPGRGSDLPRNSPESQGVDSAAIAAFVETANKKIDSLHSLMIVRHGQVIAEGWWAPYDAKTPHSLYSLSKSFTSTGVGMAIAEGKLPQSKVAGLTFQELHLDGGGDRGSGGETRRRRFRHRIFSGGSAGRALRESQGDARQ